ncbi:MAG: hypothetical protein JXO22_02805 [Phycisphaerae bacterium]|nr:hypothetical protein [Phycisphaerae bacterium]
MRLAILLSVTILCLPGCGGLVLEESSPFDDIIARFAVTDSARVAEFESEDYSGEYVMHSVVDGGVFGQLDPGGSFYDYITVTQQSQTEYTFDGQLFRGTMRVHANLLLFTYVDDNVGGGKTGWGYVILDSPSDREGGGRWSLDDATFTGSLSLSLDN